MPTAIVAALALLMLSTAGVAAEPRTSVKVEIDGATQLFDTCALRSESQVIEAREGGGGFHSGPGPTRFPHVVCSRSLSTDKSWWQWRKQIEQGTVNRKTLVIIFLNQHQQELARFKVVRAWPAVARVEKDPPVEEIEIAHEGLERQ